MPCHKRAANRSRSNPRTILFSVAADGDYYWNEQKIGDSELEARLAGAAARNPQPELHIRGDKDARYERIAQALAAAARAGVKKVGFVTEPVRN